MGKERQKLNKVEDGKKPHFSKKLQGLFKMAADTSARTSLMLLREEAEKQNITNKACTTQSSRVSYSDSAFIGVNHGQNFMGLENHELLFCDPYDFASFTCDFNGGRDLMMAEGVGDAKYSTDDLKLCSQEDMIKEFLKDKLF